ncbi:MAG: Ig-like domain-containing protein [Alphaproteobacteria bacterium]|nr:Ig-like domain-containing protein [Alphaproteobacteria bacterium]
MKVGDDDITLAPKFYPDTGATDKSVSYVSSSDSVATVTSGGVVHAVGAGTATITITSTATYPEGATPPSKQITVTVASA